MTTTSPFRIPYAPTLVPGHLERRYKRFFADVRLADGRTVVAHCANTGSMKGCLSPGSRVWLTPHDDPKRKLQWTWEIASEGEALIGVNTSLPNQLVAEAAARGALPGFTGYRAVRREVRYGERSRIDVLLEDHPDDPRPCWVEIKNVTLADAGHAMFPDAVTARGLKHLHELAARVAAGDRATIFFLIQRTDARSFGPARHIDPAYAEALEQVAALGVEVHAWQAEVTPEYVGLARALPVRLDG